ncbi:MAG: c-type cytochrome [Gammaproteobacteria bacterium]|nr:c-type cytochrome [Gammaproteobacteria bacterium]
MKGRTGIAIGLLAALGVLAAHAGGEATPPEQYYSVVDGKVDRATYTGWQVFLQNCSGCHGAGAVGTSLAPSLTERINSLSINEFRAKVLNRYFISVPVQDAVSEGSEAMREAMEETVEQAQQREKDLVKMPPWRNNPDVRDHVDELYAYLTARADGVIGPDAPQVMER